METEAEGGIGSIEEKIMVDCSETYAKGPGAMGGQEPFLACKVKSRLENKDTGEVIEEEIGKVNIGSFEVDVISDKKKEVTENDDRVIVSLDNDWVDWD